MKHLTPTLTHLKPTPSLHLIANQMKHASIPPPAPNHYFHFAFPHSPLDCPINYHEILPISTFFSVNMFAFTRIAFFCFSSRERKTLMQVWVYNCTTVSKGLFTWSGGPRSSGVVFLLFSRSGGHKTKETYPTRPGSPTPCKQGLRIRPRRGEPPGESIHIRASLIVTTAVAMNIPGY